MGRGGSLFIVGMEWFTLLRDLLHSQEEVFKLFIQILEMGVFRSTAGRDN